MANKEHIELLDMAFCKSRSCLPGITVTLLMRHTTCLEKSGPRLTLGEILKRQGTVLEATVNYLVPGSIAAKELSFASGGCVGSNQRSISFLLLIFL